jgi:predicted TIM-barrel fold metal-dependent hydrolase
MIALAVWLLTAPGLLAADAPPPLYKSDYRIINVHYHGAAATEAALQAELGVMDRVGIDMVVILDGDSPRGSLPAWLELQKKHADRLAIFAKTDFQDVKRPTFFADLVTNLERQARLGIKGVKVWKDLGMWVRDASGKVLAVDDPRLDPFWEKCGELGLPVLIHTADPREYWAPLTYNNFYYGERKDEDLYYHDPEMTPWAELMRQRDHVLEKHPRTTFIGAHFGSMDSDLAELGRTFEKYPNFSVDCAGPGRLRRLAKLNPQAVRDFFTRYQDRILFGTDGAILSGGRGKPGAITLYPSEDPDWRFLDPADTEAVERWQFRTALTYTQYLQYFEAGRVDLADTSQPGSWIRVLGAGLPRDVLEKFYHGNAERLIPGIMPAKSLEDPKRGQD